MENKALFKPLSREDLIPIFPGDSLGTKTGAWRTIRPVRKNKLSPCNAACPAGNDIQGYIDLVKQGKFKEGLELVRKTNPLPAVLGRVCFHPCEKNCNRAKFDEAVVIHNVEKFLGDYGHSLPREKEVKEKREEKIAIIGSGPAGLSCAYHLARIGYQVTIFEALPMAGGMMAVGIPDKRLPKDVLRAEIKTIEDLGVEIRTNTPISPGDNLLERGYSAVFVATGSRKSMERVMKKAAATSGDTDATASVIEWAAADIPVADPELKATADGKLVVEANTLATNKPGIFAGGDAVTGPGTVTAAIGTGRKASISIDRYIRGETLGVTEEEIPITSFEDLNLAYTDPAPKAKADNGFRQEVAVAEAQRCLSCGVCNNCGNCWLFCPDGCVFSKNEEYDINYEYCKGCGICSEVCPAGVITMEVERI